MNRFKVLNIGEPINGPIYGVDQAYSPDLIDGNWDVIVSNRYRKILSPEVLSKARCINLHSSLLPENRGAHPIFWSIWNGEPTGFTIHLMSETLDTGDILHQEVVELAPHLTLHQAWERVNNEMELAFRAGAVKFCRPTFDGEPQFGVGSFHKKSDLDEVFPYLKSGWDTLVADIPTCKALYYIDKIEKVRAKNNINWMDVLRIAVKADPTQALPLIRKIAGCDDEINQLLKQI